MRFNLNYRTPFFHSEDRFFEFLIEQRILLIQKECKKCQSQAVLTKNKIKGRIRHLYRCTSTRCRFRETKILKNFRTDYSELAFCVFLFLINNAINSNTIISGIKKDTFLSLKKEIILACKVIMAEEFIKLGGLGYKVQVDESVICRRGTIRNPTSTSDEIRDTTWIIGGIDNTDDKNIFIVVAPNRRSETIQNILFENVDCRSHLLTDGYPSYPRAASTLGLLHSVVDHSQGFTNSEGEHTNGIEGVWSDLKSKMRARNGVRRVEIEDFLVEFQFKKKFLAEKSDEQISYAFYKILKKLINV